MTLYDLLDLFIERKKLLWGIMALTLVGAWVFYLEQGSRYRMETVLSVTRSGLAPTTEYAYDNFYRLQADERLAETLAAYLGSVTGRHIVAETARLSPAEFNAYVSTKPRLARQGTNLVVIETLTEERATAERIGSALEMVASQYVALLNEDARDPAWFTVLSSGPTITSAKWSAGRVALAGVVSAFFFAFWGVLISVWYRGYRLHMLRRSEQGV